MTTTARIVATKAAATYTASITAGNVGNFIALDLGVNESIQVLGSDAAGTTFKPIIYIDQGGSSRTAILNRNNTTIQLTGPIDFRFSKGVTGEAVELSQYT